MVPASHWQNSRGKNIYKIKKFAQGRKTYLISERVWNNSKNIQKLSCREDFLPQHVETCANEMKGSGRIREEFKWKVGNEAPALTVGFSWVIGTSLVSWEAHLCEAGAISRVFWQVLINLEVLYQSSLEKSDYWGPCWTSEGTSGSHLCINIYGLAFFANYSYARKEGVCVCAG